ncbi:MAG TPA: hypothetical protein VND64_36595 [Pirellulales bacterium]|nr:hypothetical protein [Pirellulales bacterium]
MTEIVLFHVLAATSGAAFGLLAIWAGLGRLHWSVRFIPVTAVIVSLFPVPAYDLALVFVSQALVVAVPLILVRRFTALPAEGIATEAPPGSHASRRFSVADLFRLTLLIAAVFGVVAYLPGDVRASWWKYVLLGAGFGVATLAGAWAALANRPWWIRLGVVCLVAPLAGVPTALDRETYFFSRGRGVLQWPWCAVTAAVAFWSTRFEKDNHGRSATLKLLICELALAQYIADHGGPPKDLADLVPRYLPEVPEDPFSGRPLVYRTEPTGYVLYSVGQNGLDDGGQRGTSFTDGDLFLDPASPPASDAAGED